ncbi:hypothetical protein [Paenibacillus ihumii]|uniref:hypothetical protein n=1 Tax=Paenibacillus ihumii TaxID=687436 RepID=UPI0006D84502|nr:hypothetical protein [Paenibacillus ihumii]
MAQSKEVFGRAKRLQGRPVCITLHSGKTYVGYITDVTSSGLTLASAGAQPSTSSSKQGTRSKQRRASGNRSGSKRSGARKPAVRSRTRKPDAQISAFLPILGSLFGGLGGTGATAGALGGALGSGMKLFGMIQRVIPVVRLGYGMIKSIRPFIGAVQGLMKPSGSAATEGELP